MVQAGYLFKVGLDYPTKLHNTRRDLPLCAEHFTPPTSKTGKLITNLDDKNNYIIHLQNLKQVLELKITTIHRILKFKQKP